jgi:hypothetical protein
MFSVQKGTPALSNDLIVPVLQVIIPSSEQDASAGHGWQP